MSKKKIIIITLCMALLFLLIFIIAMLVKNKSNDTKIIDHTPNYAVNDTNTSSSNSLDEETNTENSIVVNNITYTNIDILTPAQQTDEANMINLITNYADHNIRKSITAVEFYDSSSDEIISATIYYYDEEEKISGSEDLAILYDKYNTKSFMRCINADYWNSIQQGENAGSE